MKPGYKTTEFWLALAAVIAGAITASGILDQLGHDHWVVKLVGIVVSVLGALGYGGYRFALKSNEIKAAALANAVEKAPDPPPPA